MGYGDEDDERWRGLGERLRSVNPDRYRQVVEAVSDIVEAQEVLATADDFRSLRARLKTRRFCA